MEDTEKLQLGIILMYLNTRGIVELKGSYHTYNGKIVFEGLNKFYITRYKKHKLQKNIISFITKQFQEVLSKSIKIESIYKYHNNEHKHRGEITMYIPEGTYQIGDTLTTTNHRQERFHGQLMNK